MHKRLRLKQVLFRKTLLDIVNDADVFLQDLLRLKNDVAAVRGNIDLVSHVVVSVIHIYKGQSPRSPRQTGTVPLYLPQFSIEVGFSLQDKYVVMLVHGEFA